MYRFLKLPFIIPIFLMLFKVEAQEQACPFGWKFNGEVCVDYTGDNSQCANGQYFDFSSGGCVPEYFRDIGSTDSSNVCSEGQREDVDQFSGVKTCVGNNSEDKDPMGRDNIKKASACDRAVASTKRICLGTEIGAQVATLIKAVQAQKSAGNIKDACDKAAQVSQYSAAGNTAVAMSCNSAINNCKNACATDVNVVTCEMYENRVKLASAQAVASTTSFAASKACSDAASGKCVGEAAYLDSECAQFCTHPSRQTHPKCQLAQNNCHDAQFASKNIQLCICITNPLSSLCRSQNDLVAGKQNPIPSGSPSSNPDLSGSSGGGEYDFGGSDAKNSGSQVAAPSDGSGSFAGGSSGSAGFAGGAPPQNSKEKIDKNVLNGTSGSGGAYVGGGSGGGGSGGGAWFSKGGTREVDTKPFNLKDYLPNGAKDPSRHPASNGFGDTSITAANGLSNWQKITRKMNEKRPELMP